MADGCYRCGSQPPSTSSKLNSPETSSLGSTPDGATIFPIRRWRTINSIFIVRKHCGRKYRYKRNLVQLELYISGKLRFVTVVVVRCRFCCRCHHHRIDGFLFLCRLDRALFPHRISSCRFCLYAPGICVQVYCRNCLQFRDPLIGNGNFTTKKNTFCFFFFFFFFSFNSIYLFFSVRSHTQSDYEYVFQCSWPHAN